MKYSKLYLQSCKKQTKKGTNDSCKYTFLINTATSKEGREVDAAAGKAQWQPGEVQKVPKPSPY